MKLKEFLRVLDGASVTVGYNGEYYRKESDIELLEDAEIVYITPVNRHCVLVEVKK